MTESEQNADVILQRIIITRRLRGDDGQETVSFDYEADTNWVADLGLLTAAQHDLTDRMRPYWDGTAGDD